jgi:Rrf2 family protein
MAVNSRFAVATHIMVSLGCAEPGEKKCSGGLAASVNTNAVVIRRLIQDLKRAGLVETTAGKAGGMWLARKATAISLYDIYEAVDSGELFGFSASKPNPNCPIGTLMERALRPVFQSAQKAVAEELKSVKLSQLINEIRAQI